MTKKAKMLILIFSFMAFFILSYLIVLYAYGYQFDFQNFKWVKTGSLLIKTNTEAQIFIDDRLRGKTSFISNTFVEKNLLPGRYDVRIEKEGFFSLVKEAEIKSGEVVQLIHLYLTNVEEISNFLSATKEKEELKDPLYNGLLSPDGKKSAVISENEISVFWLKDDDEPPYFKKDQKELVLRIGEKIEKVLWFKTNWHLIYLTADEEMYFVELDPTGGRNDVKL